MSDDETRAQIAAARAMDALRTRAATMPLASETPGRQVPCMGCGRPVEISGAGWDAARVASERLIARGEQPLGNHEMTRCPACSEAWTAEWNRVGEARNAKVADLIRVTKEKGVRPPPEVFQWLKRSGYPEVCDGIEAILAHKDDQDKKGHRGSRGAR